MFQAVVMEASNTETEIRGRPEATPVRSADVPRV